MENKETIISIYKKIHHILFSYGIRIGIGIFGLICIYKILFSGAETIAISPQLDQKNIQRFESILEKQIRQADDIREVVPIVLLGQITNTLEELNSYNNILSYKGFIVPRFFGITRTIPLQSLEYYEKGTYTKDEMETIFRNIIVGSNKRTQDQAKNQQIILQEPITSTFHLECLNEDPVYKGACNTLVKNFLTVLPFLNIDNQEQETTTLRPKIVKDTKNRDFGCQQREKYMLYTKSYKPRITEVFITCSDEQKDELNRIMNTIETENELDNKIISTKTYQDNNINIYKLLSFGQILYDDIQNQRVNTDRIKSFLSFQEELLKKKKLSRFYKDIIYYINNYYIRDLLDSSETKATTNEKQGIEELQKTISSINNGNDLLGYAGIGNEINQELFLKELTTIAAPKGNTSSMIENAINQMQNFQITEKKQNESGTIIKGIRSLANGDSINMTINLSIEIALEEINKIVVVKDLLLPDYPDITTTIKQLIIKNNRNFLDLQKYIATNASLFNKGDTISDTKTICAGLQTQGGQITNCNNNNINIDFLRNNKIINMNISHNNFIISNIELNSSEAKKNFQEILQKDKLGQTINTTKITSAFLDEIINTLRNYTPKTASTISTGSSQTIITIDKIKKYLGVEPSDVLEKDGKTLIAFSLKNIEFIGNFDTTNNTITALYFRKILTNKNPTFIKNIQLVLDDIHKTEDEQFTVNPLNYIKDKNPEIYIYYQQFIGTPQ